MDDLDPATFDDSGEVERLPPLPGGEVWLARNSPDRRTGEFAGKITDVQGDVYVKRPDGTTHKAQKDDILVKGDVVVTGRGSKVELREPQGGRVRLGSSTAMDTDSGRTKGRTNPDAVVGTLG